MKHIYISIILGLFLSINTIFASAPMAAGFSGEYSSNMGAVELSWDAIIGLEAEAFVIERSTDGYHYEQIAQVSASIELEKGSQYTYVDDDNYIGFNYYRLSMVDQEGVYETGTTLVQAFDKEKRLKVFPNPTKRYLKISAYEVAEEEVRINLVDVNGRLVMDQIRSLGDDWSMELDLYEYDAGVYLLYIITAEKVDTKRIVILAH